MRIGELSGVARPARGIRQMAHMLHGPRVAMSLEQILEDSVTVDGLAKLLDKAIEAGVATDGRIDLRVAAMHLINNLKRNQR